MDEKIKTWTLSFPAKENPNMEKALFAWSIVLQHDVNAKYGVISRTFPGLKVFSPECSPNQPKATRVCVHDKPIKSLYFHVFVSVLFEFFSFQGHTKIALNQSLFIG